jgi:abhydrolase domain-containing protein 11
LEGKSLAGKLEIRFLNFTAKLSSLLFQAPVRLAYNTYENVKGSAETPPLIVMHGLFGSKFNWNSLCKAIHAKSQPTRKIICVDARNHADSPWSSDHSYAHMAADIRDLLQRLEIQKAAILGHSMGGRAMMYFALQHPELVEKAIIVDISPISGLGTNMTDIPLFLNAMRAIQVPATQTIHQGRQEADRQLSTIIAEKSLRDFLITNLVKGEDGSFSWRINLEALERNFIENIAQFPDLTGVKRYDGPVLFIGGERSDYLK